MGYPVVHLKAFALVLLLFAAPWSPAQARPLNEEEIRHLLRRTSYEVTDEAVTQVRELGLEGYLDEQFSPRPELPVLSEALADLPYQEGPPGRVYRMLLDEPNATTLVEQEMLQARLLRGVYSRNPLREVMTDFWFNHFNADPDKGPVVACNIALLERGLRENAFGSFADLLNLAVRNPAVLENLDNTVSQRPAVNENFGREVMELYTVGPVHSQHDVVEMARCFSGWSYESDPESPDFLRFRYYPERHALGNKRVLGHNFQDHQQGEVLRMLAGHPATAKFLSRKLVIRFVCDEPPTDLVNRASAVYLSSGGDVEQVLRTILGSEEFFAPEHRFCKMRSPLEYAVSVLKGLPEAPEEGDWAAAMAYLEEAGSPYSCPNPLGWPDRRATWLSTAGQDARTRLVEQLSPRTASRHLGPEFQQR